ncbi:MAG: diphthine--ammonia ligase [Halobacteriaceae archaeon]
MENGIWISLFSGGKDSSWALYQALNKGHDVVRLITVHPEENSYFYHVPGTHIAQYAAESIGIPLYEIDSTISASTATDSTTRGDAEIHELAEGIKSLQSELDATITGIIAGAVESEYQHSRVATMSDDLGMNVFTPLWKRDPETLLRNMMNNNFEIKIIEVGAKGFDESWLGRTIDEEAIDELLELHEKYGVHILGEGGEYETLVLNGPHMDQKIQLSYSKIWNDTWGYLDISEASFTTG